MSEIIRVVIYQNEIAVVEREFATQHEAEAYVDTASQLWQCGVSPVSSAVCQTEAVEVASLTLRS